MTDFIAANFGLLELILFVELIVLFTAAFFYWVANLASRGSRHDPMVRFYYVFWRGFFADVTSVGVMQARHAEAVARAAGVVAVGDMEPEQLARPDAPDLGSLTTDDLRANPIAAPVPAYATPPAGPSSAGGPSRSKPTPAAPPADSTLDVRVLGGMAADRITGREGRAMVAEVRNEIEDGQANGVVVQLVSAALGAPVYRIVLLRGHYKSDKAFKIIGIEQTTLDAMVSRL